MNTAQTQMTSPNGPQEIGIYFGARTMMDQDVTYVRFWVDLPQSQIDHPDRNFSCGQGGGPTCEAVATDWAPNPDGTWDVWGLGSVFNSIAFGDHIAHAQAWRSVNVQGVGVTTFMGQASSTFKKVLPRLYSTSTEPFNDSRGPNMPVRLQAVNMQPVFRVSGGTHDAARYQEIAEKGFNAVRFILHWNNMEPTKGNFTTAPDPDTAGRTAAANWADLRTAVQRANDAGLHVVFNPVHFVGGGLEYVPGWAKANPNSSGCDPTDSITIAKSCAGGYIRHLASQFQDFGGTIAGYDLVNEAGRCCPVGQSAVLDMYDRLIFDELRVVDGDQIALIEPAYGNSNITGSCKPNWAELRSTANVVWSPHIYAMGGGADADGYRNAECDQARMDQGHAGGWNYAYESTAYDDYSPSADNLNKVERQIAIQKHGAAIGGNLPTWLGEWGVHSSATSRDGYVQDFAYTLDRRALGSGIWEYTGSNEFAIWDGSAWKAWAQWMCYSAPASSADDCDNSLTPTAGSTGDPVVIAVGDTSKTGTDDDATAQKTRDVNPAAILHLGDFQYEYGTTSLLSTHYEPQWGTLRHKTFTTFGGSHDCYGMPDGTSWSGGPSGGCVLHGYFNEYAPRKQPDAGGDAYATVIGNWRSISLPSYCAEGSSNVNGECGLGVDDATHGGDASAVTQKLKDELDAANRLGQCALVFWHKPYWSSGTAEHTSSGGASSLVSDEMEGSPDVAKTWMQEIEDRGGDLVLYGHQHGYERWNRMDPDDNSVDNDPSGDADPIGIPTITVGTGGTGSYTWLSNSSTNVASQGPNGVFGVLKLTLRADKATIEFERTGGTAWADPDGPVDLSCR